MNFFEAQDRVRKSTVKLVLLFTLAVITLMIMTNLLVMVVFGYINSQQMQDGGVLLQQMDWQTFATVSVGVGAVVLVGSLYKIMVLSSGGKVVAEALNGSLIPQNTDDLKHRKLLNVVEEMAIASGTPAPPVYLLKEEAGINAFAAGFTPRDAVIGVTQGTIDHLSRDQLQGVIAHEFSHIFNGDMRLNIRLIGVLNGILIIGIAGYYILRSTSYSSHRRSNDKGAGGIMALAIGLMVIGFAGSFFGGLIKAAVSRQREYLADASAVQFTRNPDGIGGALKRIGGLSAGSTVANPGAPEISHALFAQGISGFMKSLSATHPPLSKRILRIDPRWDGEFLVVDQPDPDSEDEAAEIKTAMSREELARRVAPIAASVAISDVANAIDQIGNPRQETIAHARSLISDMPVSVKDAAHDPYGARTVVYFMVFDNEAEARARQMQHLRDHADPEVYELMHKLAPELNELDFKFRLPLIDIVVPALKQLSLAQYLSFRKNLVALVEMDDRIELLEWSLQKILFCHLDEHFFKRAHSTHRYAHLGQLKNEIELLVSVMVYTGQQDQVQIDEAFRAAERLLELGTLQMVAKNTIRFPELDQALIKLSRLKPLAKPQLLKACAASIAHDQKISATEVELLRAFSDVLDCPMPPLVSRD